MKQIEKQMLVVCVTIAAATAFSTVVAQERNEEKVAKKGFEGDFMSFEGPSMRVETTDSDGVSGSIGYRVNEVVWENPTLLRRSEGRVGLKRYRGDGIERDSFEVDADVELLQRGPGDTYGSVRGDMGWDIPFRGNSNSTDDSLNADHPMIQGSIGLTAGVLTKNENNGNFMALGLCMDALYRNDDITEGNTSGVDVRAGLTAQCFIKPGGFTDPRRIHGEFEISEYLNGQDGDLFIQAGVRYQNKHASIFTGYKRDDRGMFLDGMGVVEITPRGSMFGL